MQDWKSFLYLPLLFFLILFGSHPDLSASENRLEEGITQYKAENYEEALESLAKARQERPDDPVAAYYLGMTCKQMGNYKEASRNLKAAARLAPPVKEAYVELIDVLNNLNELSEAMEWVKKAETEGEKPGQVAFLKGLILSKKGRSRDAIDAFKKAKEADPSLAQASDLQIAMAHGKEKRFAEAKESLKTVISMEPTSELGSFAKEYETALTKAAEGQKTWRVTLGVAYQYDDNVVLKPSEAIPGVLITGEKDSSVVSNLRLDYTPLLSGPWFFAGQFNFYADTYFSVESHRLMVPTLSLIPGYSFQNGAITLPVSYSYVWLHEEGYQSVVTAKPTLNIAFLPNHIGQISAGYARRDMQQEPIDQDEDRTGNIYLFTAGYVHPFSEGRGVLSFLYELSRDMTDGKNWVNTGNRFDLSLLLPIVNNVKLTAVVEAFLQDYSHIHTIFKEKRKDRTYMGAVGAIWEMTKGLNLNIQYSHTKADSNIEIYKYDRNVYTVGLEYVF
jgi:tetratricopeptide (TPR) repeat protein